MLKSSHVLCKVNDLNQAVEQWRRAGFEVQWAADPETAINALIWFETGPFIELINTVGAQPPETYRAQLPAGMLARFDRWLAAPEGWCDLCLESPGDIVPHLKTFKTQGIESVGPIVGQRTPPNGEEIRIQTCFPTDPGLPFFMGAYVPDARPKHISHPNGATSIATIELTAPAGRDNQYATLVADSDQWLRRSEGEYDVHALTLYGLRQAIPAGDVNQAVISPASGTSE